MYAFNIKEIKENKGNIGNKGFNLYVTLTKGLKSKKTLKTRDSILMLD